MQFRLCNQKNAVVPKLAISQALAALFLVVASVQTSFAQNQPPLNIFTNYFVTGDYVVGGWVENPNLFGNGFATGTISIPDCTQYQATGVACPASVVPPGADIMAAYLYWATVEGNQTLFAGQQAVFNGYNIVGTVLGNPNAPTSWSSGGCTGSSAGSKTMRMYRADVRPFLPLDLDKTSPTFGAILANPTVTVKIADSGSNGNTQPNALGATLVLIYRLLTPPTPLNAIVLYDGSYAPSNAVSTMTQNIVGFYQPSGSTAKITHIVANGQPNKLQTAYFGPNSGSLKPLPNLYSGFNTPFPGIYGAWDNPTWPVPVTGGLAGFDTTETTAVSPTSTNGGCVNWGAVIFSTPVQDSDGDGLLDTWEQNQGYTDAVSGNHIALPGANANTKDLFVQVDYLTLRDINNNVLHSHLPKEQALKTVGQAFANQGVNVHFDLPAGIYTGDPYVISTGANQKNVGANEIPENSLLCTDGKVLCPYPNQPFVTWKSGLEGVQNTQIPNAPQGNTYFQQGRGQSYRYALFGHSAGEPRFYWGTYNNEMVTNDVAELAGFLPQLVSIVDVNNTATITIESPSLVNGLPPQFPPLVVKPGDCSGKNQPQPCGDANSGRVTISGSLTTATFTPGTLPTIFPLNGTYTFNKASSSGPDANGVITTTFQVTTSGVASGTYQFSCNPANLTNPPCIAEPQLGVSYLGPTTTSGHADFGGGGDAAITLGLWGSDDVAGCQADPSQPAGAQGYCNNLVGTLKVQTGTLMHELGHTLTLTHGGAYYDVPNFPSVARYDMNCKSNFISVMNYLFQVRGFPDVPGGGFDYSGQNLQLLNESSSVVNGVPALSEMLGVGNDVPSGQTAEHLTRWYSTPNPTDNLLTDQALAHCDGTAIAQGEPASVRVDGTLAPGGTFSGPLDWNNDLVAGNDPIPSEDLNHNGIIDPPYAGLDEWQVLLGDGSTALQQMNARSSGFGFSDGGGLQKSPGTGLQKSPGTGVDGDGAGLQKSPGTGLQKSPGTGLQKSPGTGEQNTETANSTVDPPTNLACTAQGLLNGVVVPGCTPSTGGTFQEKAKAIPLSWAAPDFGQIRSYFIWRAVGSFQTPLSVLQNIKKFSQVGVVNNPNGAAATSTVDTFQLKSNTTYTYFVTDQNKFQAKSKNSQAIVVTLQF